MNQSAFVLLDETGVEAIVRRVLDSVKHPEPPPLTKPGKALLTVEEVCQLLSISRVTLHCWKKSGRIPYHRIGHRVYFKEEEILGAMRSMGMPSGANTKKT